MDPTVTVIIPSYNRRKFILEAIDSASDQINGDIEVIVVDDGSSDGSLELLRDCKKDRDFALLTHPNSENRGQSAAINLGILSARGEFIAILDSDDKFAEGKLHWQLEYLRANEDVGMVYGQGHAVDENGNFLFEIPGDGHEERSDPNQLLLDCYLALPGGSLIKKAVFDEAGLFEEDFRAGQDHDMALRIMEVTKVAYVPKLAFYYRKHEDSISTKGLLRRWVTGKEILKRAAKRYPYQRRTLRKRNAVVSFRLGQTYWKESSKLLALKYFVKAGLLDPLRALKVLAGRE